MSKFYKGQIVRIDPTSEYYYAESGHNSSNPVEIDGKVTMAERSHPTLTVMVEWSNGTSNTYAESDLFSPEAEIGDTVQVIGAGPDDFEYKALRGTSSAYHNVHKGTQGVVYKEGTQGKSMLVRFGLGTQYIPNEYFVLMERGQKQLIEEVPMKDKAEVAKEKLKYKRYTDGSGDSFKVDCQYSTQHVSFEPKDDKEDVILDAKQVIALRKQLKQWLVANGHNKGE